MSDGIRGIHYEISEPVQNPVDGYYYQRVRQVDVGGNLVGVGEQVFKSVQPDSTDGLIGLPVDLGKLGSVMGDIGQVAWGALSKNLRSAVAGAAKLGSDASAGILDRYRSWPGTSKPWEPLLNWQKGGSPIDFVQSGTSGEIGNGNGIGNWWDSPRSVHQNRPSSRDSWANIPIPDASTPPLPSAPAWNDVFVRDSAAAAGVPSRNNVFEFGFPEFGPARPSVRGASSATPSFRRDAAFIGDNLLTSAEAVPRRKPLSRGPIASDLLSDETQEIASKKPVRYLARRIVNNSPASVFDTSAPATPDGQDSFSGRFGNWTSSPGIAPRNPNLAVPPPERGRPLGIFTGKPMPEWIVPLPFGGLSNNSDAPGDIVDWISALAGEPDDPA